jgi:hypothetical protein
MFDALDSELPSSIRRLAIINDLTGELIGTIGFHTVSDVNRTAELLTTLRPRIGDRELRARYVQQ